MCCVVAILLCQACGVRGDDESAEGTTTSDPGTSTTLAKERAPALPTPTCNSEQVQELAEAFAFVEGKSWTDRPKDTYFGVITDTTRCRVVVLSDQLSQDEEARLREGGGPRLEIEHVPPPRQAPATQSSS